MLRWIGEVAARPGRTPQRVVDGFNEHFHGHATSPEAIPAGSFDEIEWADGIVLLRDVAWVED